MPSSSSARSGEFNPTPFRTHITKSGEPLETVQENTSPREIQADLSTIEDVPSAQKVTRGGFLSSKAFKIGLVALVLCGIAGGLGAGLGIYFLKKNTSNTTSGDQTSVTTATTTTTTTATTATTTTVTTTTSTATTTSVTTTTASTRAFALSQVIDGQTVTCSSVVNSNPSYTECDNLQKGGLYGPNGISCTPGWTSSQSPYWSELAFCQAFAGSSNTYVEAYYNCNTGQTRFTWASHTWGTTSDNGYTQNLRCYY